MRRSLFFAEEKARLDAVDRWSNTVGRSLLHFACPIYAHGARHPEAVGSAVLLNVCGEAVLVTAAHVLDEIGVRALSFGAANTILPIAGWRTSTSVPAGGTRDDDVVDIAFVRLASSASSYLEESDLLDVAELDRTTHQPLPTNSYFVTGFPATRQPRRMVADTFESRPFTFVSEEVGAVDDPHLLVEFEKATLFRGGLAVSALIFTA